MSRFNMLLHGSASEAAALLSSDNPIRTDAELRAALTNALNRIDRLENVRVARIEAYINRKFPEDPL